MEEGVGFVHHNNLFRPFERNTGWEGNKNEIQYNLNSVVTGEGKERPEVQEKR